MIRGANTFDVFVRDWWRAPTRGEVGRQPGPGPRRYIARGVSWSEARELCADYNASHDPGPYSRKAEFEAA